MEVCEICKIPAPDITPVSLTEAIMNIIIIIIILIRSFSNLY